MSKGDVGALKFFDPQIPSFKVFRISSFEFPLRQKQIWPCLEFWDFVLGFSNSVFAERDRRDAALDLQYSHSGRGAVWLARLNGVQEVAGSNPVAPTVSQTQIPPPVAEATGDGI